MTRMKATRYRGLSGIRAETTDPVALVEQINVAFEAYKAKKDAEIADLRRGQRDVVRTEEIDRLNAEITTLNKSIAALQVGGSGSGDNVDPAVAEHAQAFNQFFRRGVDAGLKDLEVKAKLTTQSDPDGGYLVPKETEAGIDRVLGTVSTVRSLARKVNISTSTYKKLVSMGGAGSGWVGEEQARPETATPMLREIAINTSELYAAPIITQTLLDDAAYDIAVWLAGEVAIEFAEKEGDAFVNGDGVNKPRGILGYDMVANASYQWGKVGFITSGASGAFKTPTASVSPADALIDLSYALKQGYRGGASWLMTDGTMAAVRQFKDANGAYIWAPPSAPNGVPTILGKPAYTDDNMPVIAANSFSIAFGDFARAYLIVDRVGIRVLRDPFTNKPYVTFYTTKRVGGGIVNFEAIKLMKFAS